MLDQNTDRMWYVIGALVVGAGIILLANKTMPEAFANVADAFKGVADESTKSASKLKVQQGNLINDADAKRVWSADTNTLSWGPEYVRTVNLAPIIDKYGTNRKYDIAFDIKSSDISKVNHTRVYMLNGSKSKYTFTQIGDKEGLSIEIYPKTEYQRVTLNDVQFKLSDQTIDNAYLSFYGYYDTGNSPTITNIHVSLAE